MLYTKRPGMRFQMFSLNLTTLILYSGIAKRLGANPIDSLPV